MLEKLKLEDPRFAEDPAAVLELLGIPFSGSSSFAISLTTDNYEMTGLGYLRVDVAIDREEGPMLLELNARLGLGIQIANRQGLLRRLEAVDEEKTDALPPEERLILGKTIAQIHTVS